MLSSSPAALRFVDQTADLLVHAVDQGRVGRHAPALPRPPLGAQARPGRDVVGTRGGLHVLAEQAEFRLPLRTRLADDIPAHVIASQVLPVVLLQRLERRVRRVVGDVEEPGLLRLTRLVQESQRVVGVRDGGVEALTRHLPFPAIQPERVVPGEVIARAREVAEVALEAEIGRLFVQVPLAGHGGEVAGPAQHLGRRDGPAQGGVARLEGVATGEEADARGVALGRVGELAESQPARREPIQVRRLDLAAVAAEVGVSEVVGHDDQHVGARRLGGGRAATEGNKEHREHKI